jgi:apolipoprotein D and lipocalin family protein
MTVSTHPPPAALSRTEPPGLSLDERIRAAEERLVEREHRLRRSAHALRQGVQRAVQPWRAALPVAGAAGVALLWWFWRGRRPHAVRTVAPAGTVDAGWAGDAGGSGASGVPWVRMVALAWPLLPAAWRSRVSPALASTLVGLGLPVVESLLREHEVPPLATMPWVDLAHYAGTWQVLARLPAPGRAAGARCSAHYTLRDDGGLTVHDRCIAADGSLRAVRGVARAVVGSGGARWRVSLWPQWLRWLPMAWSDYWILHVDDEYSEALVGSPARDFLWLLAREPGLTPERMQRLVQIAQDRGFAVERLHFGRSV